MLLDLHTHRPAPQESAIVCVDESASLLPSQAYSMGLHPWDIPPGLDEMTLRLDSLARRARSPQVAAIGEAGLDALRGAPMALQLLAFRRQALLAEQLGKPLIVHDVKCHEALLSLHAEIRPRVRWIVHGFRGKPQVARMFLDKGIALSYGERFNAASLAVTPSHMLYAETDESPLAIDTIIKALSVSAGRNIRPEIAANMAALFG